MGMLNFACFLSEGIGVALVGGLLSRRLLEIPLLPVLRNAGADLYSNLLLFSLVIVAGSMIYTLTYVGKKQTNLKHRSIFVIQISLSLVTTESGILITSFSYATVATSVLTNSRITPILYE